MEQLLRIYSLGDMQAVYILNGDNQTPELLLLPEGYLWRSRVREKAYTDNLLQIKIQGDAPRDGYSGGISMRQSSTVEGFKYDDQEEIEDTDPVSGKARTRILTTLKDERGYEAVHTLSYVEGESAIRSYVNFKNFSRKKVTLEMLSSFSLGKMSPYMDADGADSLKLHRVRSCWSSEGRLESRTIEDLQLEPSWGGHAVRCERFGCVGSLPVNKYFPVMVLEDCVHHICWGAQLAHNCSWQMELYRRGDDIQMSGGIADREYGHWMKTIKAGGEFTTPEAILTVCNTTDFDETFQRMTSELDRYVEAGPESEQSLPVMFNEYCTTWGVPSQDNISHILEAIKGHGFEYFVIDAGWYKADDVPWDHSMGDYEVSKTLFPDGLDATVKSINAAGMKAGLWFEVDNVGDAAKTYENTDLLLHRDGKVFETMGRRFFDLRKPETIDYLKKHVIGTLKKYGLEYIKIDCNDTVGIGCDGAESLGEGLRQNQEASVDFIRRIKKDVPGIIVENCASGGHKLEPLMMSECAMASFSDAHECPEIPIIAANLHRVILPRQSQIWAVIREADSLKRIVYSIAATFLGRMCVSGDVWKLDDAQWKVIDEGISFYKMVSPIIKNGYTTIYDSETTAWRHPKGWQAVVRTSSEKGMMVVVHAFEGSAGQRVSVPIPIGYSLKSMYSHMTINLLGRCEFVIPDDNMAVAFYFE